MKLQYAVMHYICNTKQHHSTFKSAQWSNVQRLHVYIKYVMITEKRSYIQHQMLP